MQKIKVEKFYRTRPLVLPQLKTFDIICVEMISQSYKWIAVKWKNWQWPEVHKWVKFSPISCIVYLTYWGRDEMATNLQTSVSNIFLFDACCVFM